MKTLANSPGWIEKPLMMIHSLEPYISVPMNMGSRSSSTPMAPKVYLYFFTTSRFFTSTSVMTMKAIAAKRIISWLMASAGFTRVTNVMPMPESRNTTGRMAGSAPGARKRTAMWAAAKAANRPMGTASVWNESAAPVVTT